MLSTLAKILPLYSCTVVPGCHCPLQRWLHFSGVLTIKEPEFQRC